MVGQVNVAADVVVDFLSFLAVDAELDAGIAEHDRPEVVVARELAVGDGLLVAVEFLFRNCGEYRLCPFDVPSMLR